MTSEIELRLPPEPIAPTLARAALATLGSDVPDPVISDVQLLTTEVVSNAVRHASLMPSQEIVLLVEINGSIRVEVLDEGRPFRADPGSPDGPGHNGWGLFLLDALATSWGVEPQGSGKKVWFEVGTADRATRRSRADRATRRSRDVLPR
jgi:anti-sigma regulatory factor (Ser/Thr protein kinase)